MYNDNASNAMRDGWKFTYCGQELSQVALRLYRKYRQDETGLRSKLGGMIAEVSRKLGGRDDETMRKDAEHAALMAERCHVWYHEFVRNPAREYQLGIADVCFFELMEPIPDESPAQRALRETRSA